MRFGRIAVIAGVIFLSGSSLQAQLAHSQVPQPCCCPECAGSCGFLGDVSNSLASALSFLNPCHIGGDARHKIYKSALVRNTFDKKCLLPIPYYAHVLPMYRHNRCCCGPLTTPACQQCQDDCYAEQTWEEGGVEMYEDTGAMPAELEPAAEAAIPVSPDAIVPAKEAQNHTWRGRSAARGKRTAGAPPTRAAAKPATTDRVAEESGSKGPSLKDFIKFVGRSERQQPNAVQPASSLQPIQPAAAPVANPLR